MGDCPSLCGALVSQVQAAAVEEDGLGELAAPDADVCISLGIGGVAEAAFDASAKDCIESSKGLWVRQFAFGEEVFRKAFRGGHPKVGIIGGYAGAGG